MSNEAKFTPEPWKLRKSGDGKRIRISAPGDGYHRLSCDIDGDDCDSDTAMANARLLLAAPKMYAALKQFVAECDSAPSADKAPMMAREALDTVEGKVSQ